MFNKILFFILLFVHIASYSFYIAFIFDFQTVIYFPEASYGVFVSIYQSLCTILMIWGMYRGAFRKFLSPKLIYFIIGNTLISSSLDIYSEFKEFSLDYMTKGELLAAIIFYVIFVSLIIKVILSAKKIPFETI